LIPRAAWVAGGAAGLALVAGLAWLAWPRARVLPPVPHAASPSVPPAASPRPPAAPAVPMLTPPVLTPIVRADAAAIAVAAAGAEPGIFQLAGHPRVFILDFPGLTEQAAAMNRVAALLEKAGAPRDRVLSMPELEQLIAASNTTAEEFYVGHNYLLSDIRRFIALAFESGQVLTPAEQRLAGMVEAIAAAAPGPEPVAVLTIPNLGPRMDAATRAAVLGHELGHGVYFTNPGYARHVHRLWHGSFTEAERAAFRRFLGSVGYDAQNEELMINEMQAYLLFTRDARFFAPAMVDMADARAEELRAMMRQGLQEP
jgi:hypothetical protein